MFWNVLHLESDKIFRRLLLWAGLLIALAPMVVFLLVAFTAGRGVIPTKTLMWPGGIATVLAFANGYFPGVGYGVYLLAVVIGLVTSQEYSWRTMQLWLSHGITRSLLLGVKFVVALLVVFVIVLAFFLVGGIISMVFAYQLHGSIDFAHVNGVQLLLSYLRTVYGMLPYAALTLLLVVVTRSAAAAIGGLVLFMMAIELPLSLLLPLLGQNYAHIAQYLPAGLAQTMNIQNDIAAKLSVQTIISSGQSSLLAATICIALYTLLFFGLALWVFRQQNLAS
jgi:ABC-type transport system involved in multi-copper enzyme maturation permease subunit